MTAHHEIDPAHECVLVIDDHKLVGASLVVALAARGVQAHPCPITSTQGILESADRLGCRGVALLDLDLGYGMDGARIDEVALVRGLRARGWRVVAVSAATDPRRVAPAIAAGAMGFVAKAAGLDDLLDSVFTAAAGRPVLSPEERASWLALHDRMAGTRRRARARLSRLTAREREVLELLARGERAAVIAQEATVSLSTVRSQIRSILTKLEVNSQLEAVALLRDEY